MIKSIWLLLCVLAWLNGIAAAEAPENTLPNAAFTKEGLGRLYNPHYQYATIGLGGTTMRVGHTGFTRPEAPRLMPGGYLQHRPYLAYEYWWDESGARHLPFDLSGGYGNALEVGQVTGFREHLDIATGLLTLDLDLRTDLAWEGLYDRGRDAFHSRREVFVTPEGVLVIRVTDSPGTSMPFQMRVDLNQWVRIYLNQGIYAKDHAPWSGSAEARPGGMVITADRPASCRATLAVAVEAAGVKVDLDHLRAGATQPGSTVTYYIAPGSSYAGPDPADVAWAKAHRARALGFEAQRKATAAWWHTFHGRSTVELPDPELATWYARSLYYHGVYFGNTRIPPGCNGTSIESFAGAICTEYDLAFSQYALLYTNHLDEARGVTDWIVGALPRAERYAREGLTSHQVTLKYPDGAKYSTLMGYDGTLMVPPTEGEGVNAYSNYPGANCAAMALAYADWKADGQYDAVANRVLKETTRVSLADLTWREDVQGYLDKHMPNSVQQAAAIFGLRESIRRGVAEPAWLNMRGKIVMPDAAFEGRQVITAGPGAVPFEGYGDAPWLQGLWWYGNLSPEDPKVRATYDMIRQSFTWKYVFNGGWLGVYAAKLGLAEDALRWAKQMIQPGVTVFDDSCFGELVFGPEDFKKTPEIAAHGALICNVTQMLLDADSENAVKVFPAIPASWCEEGVAFERLAGRGGLVVSAATSPEHTSLRIENSTNREVVRHVTLRLQGESLVAAGSPEGWVVSDGFAVNAKMTLPAGATAQWRFAPRQ